MIEASDLIEAMSGMITAHTQLAHSRYKIPPIGAHVFGFHSRNMPDRERHLELPSMPRVELTISASG
jgi:hypothetical protein